MVSEHLCIAEKAADRLCWIALLNDPESDLTLVQDDVTICHGCPVFESIAQRGTGRRAADQAVVRTAIKLMDQLLQKKENLERMTIELKKNVEQLSLLRNIADAIARSDNLEKGLRIILTGATSGDAFGFNRASVFLIDDKGEYLEGRCAIGPHDVAEAERIWKQVASIPISRLLDQILTAESFPPGPLDSLVGNVRLRLADEDHPLIGILRTARAQIVDADSPATARFDWSWWPSFRRAVGVPLISEGKALGLLWADNAVTNKPITPESVESLKAMANACAPALESAILRQKLVDQLQELQQVHELLKSNQEYLVRHERLADIGMLATKVAHEFKIPLVTIGGYARRLKNMLRSGHADETMIDVIISEVDRLCTINSEILEYSRTARLDLKECDLNTLVSESLRQMQERLRMAKVATTQVFNDGQLSIKADPLRLKQVILNLLENAVDAMHDGGRLTVRTFSTGDYVALAVEDTGIGIDEDGLNNLFKLFYTTKPKGSGLGLPVCKKIVEDHGGYITVDSVPGQGSVFTIHLPIGQK